MNHVCLSGNLTRDVEMRYLPNGTAVGAFGLAINRKWRDAAGELKEEVAFLDITAWGKQAETISEYFKKGSKILLTGRLKQDMWEDKQTQQKRSKIGVVLESFEFMGGKGNGERSAPAPKESGPDRSTAGVPTGGEAPPEDDVPF